MKLLLIKFRSLAAAVFASVISGAVFAVASADTLPRIGVTGISDIRSSILCKIAIGMFYVCISLTVIFVIVAAYRYLTSSGDPEKVRSATRTITYAAIAVVVALLARTFPAMIAGVLGVEEDVSGGC